MKQPIATLQTPTVGPNTAIVVTAKTVTTIHFATQSVASHAAQWMREEGFDDEAILEVGQ